MSNIKKLKSDIADAIQKADSSYFFEDYSKQAASVMKILEASGFRLIPKEIDPAIFKQVAENMRTGRMKPEQHVQSVFEHVLSLIEKK
jgi:hypothetical protein